MAFQRPTLPELITRVEGDLKSGLQLVVILRRSFLGVIARVMAGLAHLLFGFLKYVEQEAFPDTATEDNLDRWAGIYNVLRKEATFAEFTCTVTGTAGVVIPAGRVYRRSDGKEYTVVSVLTLPGTINLVASIAGAASEVQVADVISILSPIAGLNSNATVSVVITEPEDTEGDASLRARLLDKIRNPPSGGAANDYIQWALAVPGITRAWINPQGLGPGTVLVYVVSDDENPITPIPAKITEVFDYIEVLRPVTANVTVVAPVLLPINMTIQIKPNTVAVQNAIRAELLDLIFRDSSLAGSYKSPGVLNDGKILLSRIDEAVSIAQGEEDHNITLINGVTPADVTPATGRLAVLGTITWQALA
jgi:uncharacterized phage protein gp47/JayE